MGGERESGDWLSKMDAKVNDLLKGGTSKAVEELRQFFEIYPRVYLDFRSRVKINLDEENREAYVRAEYKQMRRFLEMGSVGPEPPKQEHDYCTILGNVAFDAQQGRDRSGLPLEQQFAEYDAYKRLKTKYSATVINAAANVIAGEIEAYEKQQALAEAASKMRDKS